MKMKESIQVVRVIQTKRKPKNKFGFPDGSHFQGRLHYVRLEDTDQSGSKVMNRYVLLCEKEQ